MLHATRDDHRPSRTSVPPTLHLVTSGTPAELRLFNADVYTQPDVVAEQVKERYLLAYRGNTRKSYESDLKLWFRWCADRGVTILEAQRWHVEMYDREVEALGRKPSTRQRKLIAICGYYEYAEQEEIIPASPGRWVRRPRVPSVSTSEFLERYEVGPFLAAAKARGVHHSALCHLLLYNGLRVSEAIGANIEDLTFSAGHRLMRITRKGGKEAEVPLAPPTFRAMLMATAERNDGPILLDALGYRMSRHAAARAVRLAASRAGIHKKIGPHALRHTFATLGLSAGIALRDMQVDMGHADVSTTIRYDRRHENPDRHSTYIVAAFVNAD